MHKIKVFLSFNPTLTELKVAPKKIIWVATLSNCNPAIQPGPVEKGFKPRKVEIVFKLLKTDEK